MPYQFTIKYVLSETVHTAEKLVHSLEDIHQNDPMASTQITVDMINKK